MSRRTPTKVLIPVIELFVVFDDGVVIGIPVEWRNGMTALDALQRASEKDHGVRVKVIGNGPTAFVTEIDGLANSMTGYQANWKYFVNGQHANVSCGVYKLKPSDIVRWEYTPFCQEPDGG